VEETSILSYLVDRFADDLELAHIDVVYRLLSQRLLGGRILSRTFMIYNTLLYEKMIKMSSLLGLTYFEEVCSLLWYVNVEGGLLSLCGHHDEPAQGELAPRCLDARAARLEVHEGVVEAHVLLDIS
jgi:hypothetical protein